MHSGKVQRVRLAGERVPDARVGPGPDARRQDLGLRHGVAAVKRVGQRYYAERAAASWEVGSRRGKTTN
jgi:hypothetical protein